MQAPDVRTVALNDALRELERVRAQFEWLSELASVWSAIEAARRTPAEPERVR